MRFGPVRRSLPLPARQRIHKAELDPLIDPHGLDIFSDVGETLIVAREPTERKTVRKELLAMTVFSGFVYRRTRPLSHRRLQVFNTFRMNTHDIDRPAGKACAPRPVSTKPFDL